MLHLAIEKILPSIAIFSHFNSEQLAALALAGTRLQVEGGSLIISEGEPSDSLYIILSGQVRIEARTFDGTDIELSHLGVGDFFGESALTDGEQSTATVKALTESEFFILKREALMEFLAQSPTLISHVIGSISRKLKHANRQTLLQFQEKHALAKSLERQHDRVAARMVTAITHEILKPLTMIHSMSQILSQDLLTEYLDTPIGDGQTLRQMLDATHLIQGQMGRLQELLNTFQYLGLEATQDNPESVNLAKTIRSILDLYRMDRHSQLELNIDVHYAAEDKPWDGFPRILSEILHRLLENIETHAYLDGQGPVSVSLKPTLLENRAAYELMVVDSGAGMSIEELDRACELFFTTDREGGHMGLGLAIVETLVTQALQGRFQIFSSPESGTRVIMLLPRKRQIVWTGDRV
jgi:signal transduction histidine kinase